MRKLGLETLCKQGFYCLRNWHRGILISQKHESKLIKQTKDKHFNIYFAYPYHSWERGTNENTNGLLRPYFPTQTEFKNIAQTKPGKKVRRINPQTKKETEPSYPKGSFSWKEEAQLGEDLRGIAFGDGM